MAIAERAVGTVKKVASGNLASIALPTGHALNDILVCYMTQVSNVAPTMSGWTNVLDVSSGTTCRESIWVLRDNGSVTAPTITRAAGDSATAFIVAYSGVDTSLTLTVGAGGVFRDLQTSTGTHTETGATWTLTFPAATAISGDYLSVYGSLTHSGTADTYSCSTVAGFAERVDTGSGTGTSFASHVNDDKAATGTAGSVTSTITYGGASGVTSWASAQLVLSSDTAGGGGTAWTQSFGDTITMTDAAAKGVVLSKADSITTSDVFTRVAVFSRSMADSITLSDAVAKALVISKADGITLVDALSKAIGPRPSDTLTLSDAFSRTVAFVRPFADTVTLTDAAAKAVGLAKSDTITLSDAVAKSMGHVVADSVTLSDAIAKTIGLGKADTVTLTDAAAKAMAHALADSITLSDAMTPSLGGGSSTAWTLNLADTITLADALHRTLTDAGASTATAAHARVIFLNRFGIY